MTSVIFSCFFHFNCFQINVCIKGREGQFATNLSTTPNGTIFGVTPGGSRITYDRETLLSLRNSPLSQTPPKVR